MSLLSDRHQWLRLRHRLTRLSTLPRTLAALQKFGRLQWNSRNMLKHRQEQKLRQITAYASTNVPFYRRLLREQHVNPSSIRSLEDLAKLPTITRRDLYRNFREMSAPGLSGRGELVTSSGSSGPAVSCYIDQITISESIATSVLFNLWASWLPGMTTLQIMRARPENISQQVYWRLMRTKFLNSLDIRNSTAKSFAKVIASSDPSLIISYPSVLGMIARNMDATPPSVRGIIVGSETITPNVARDIEESFARRAFNRYGLSEFGGVLMQDCDLHQGLHLNSELAVVEVLDSDGERVAENERGRLVITGLRNFVMPLIRYDAGDIGVAGGECACGRGFPVVSDVVGRTSDVVRGKNGDEISSFLLLNALHYYGFFAEFIAEFQFVDKAPGKVGLRIVPTQRFLDNPTKNGAYIEGRLERTLPILDFEVEIRDELRREESGKQNLVVRN